VVFDLANRPLVARVSLELSLPVTSTAVDGDGVAHVRVTVDTAEGRVPTGAVVLTSSRPLVVVPGQAGVTQSGDGIQATLVTGAAEIDVRLGDWRSRTLTATYVPDATAAATCTGGAGSLGAVVALALALSLRRRRAAGGATLVALALALALPATAAAQATVALRLGYASAAGSSSAGLRMSEGVRAAVPIQLEAGYRLLPSLTVGAFGAWGPAGAGSLCGEGSCSASLTRAGVQASWQFGRVLGLSPWLGAGTGWEWASLESKVGGDKLTVTRSGWEWLLLQGGAEVKVAARFSVGPFVQLSLARYESQTVKSPLGDASGGISHPANHSWLQLGVRGAFDL
jgi:hypothetical protein